MDLNTFLDIVIVIVLKYGLDLFGTTLSRSEQERLMSHDYPGHLIFITDNRWRDLQFEMKEYFLNWASFISKTDKEY